MTITKTIARKVIFPLITSFGFEKLFSSFSSANRMVLAYHGVASNTDFSINGRHIDAKQFEQHLVYLKSNFEIVSLQEMFDLYRKNIIPKRKTIAITFDDGCEDNYLVGLPLLKKYKMPATFYIVSSCLLADDYLIWADLFNIARVYSLKRKFSIGNIIFENIGNELYSKELRTTAFDHFKEIGESRDEVLEKFRIDYKLNDLLPKANREYWKLVTKEQLRDFSKSELVEIGSHTHKHYNLSSVNIELAKRELQISKKLIEDVIQKEVISIAYPDGSYNMEVKSASINAGYKNLIAVDYKCSDDSEDLNILPRFCISNTTTFSSSMVQVSIAFKKKGF